MISKIGMIGMIEVRRLGPALSLALVFGAVGCALETGENERFSAPPPKRAGSVVVAGCTLDERQTGTLATAAAHAVLSEVILLCPAFDAEGTLWPTDHAPVAAQVSSLHALGYKVTIAIGANDATGLPLPAPQLASLLARPDKREAMIAETVGFEVGQDRFDVALPTLDNRSAIDLTAFVSGLSSAARPRRVGIFAPPSSTLPSDLPGGQAYELRALDSVVDRIRLMTLDYSCCGAPSGPTTDPGWAVDVARTTRDVAPRATLDIAYPLYGYDFDGDREKDLSYGDAEALAAVAHVTPVRGPTSALHFHYLDGAGHTHEVWFDDATSTTRALAAWTADVLPANVGVVYYGLGGEDPSLFAALASAAVQGIKP